MTLDNPLLKGNLKENEFASHNFFNLSKEDLRALLLKKGVPKFRAQEIWSWVYAKGVFSFEQMSSLPKALRSELSTSLSLERPEIELLQTSRDGTQKLVIKLGSRASVEAVLIPTEERVTLCVSSQVGCTLNCSFCHTGTQAWVRNLTAGEILGQVLLAKEILDDWNQSKKASKEEKKLTNVVFMGMGEPFYNYENVKQATEVLLDSEGLNFSKRKITISTSGIVPEMGRCGKELGVGLAISLHAPNDELRSSIMSINKKYPLAELIKACQDYPTDFYRKITFEYVLLKDVNDSLEDAKALARLAKSLEHCKINLIPFNPWPGTSYVCSEPEQQKLFSSYLEKQGIEAPIRTPRGEDILAACGQLKSESERLKRQFKS